MDPIRVIHGQHRRLYCFELLALFAWQRAFTAPFTLLNVVSTGPVASCRGVSLYIGSGLGIAILLAAAWFIAEGYSPADAIRRKRRRYRNR